MNWWYLDTSHTVSCLLKDILATPLKFNSSPLKKWILGRLLSFPFGDTACFQGQTLKFPTSTCSCESDVFVIPFWGLEATIVQRCCGPLERDAATADVRRHQIPWCLTLRSTLQRWRSGSGKMMFLLLDWFNGIIYKSTKNYVGHEICINIKINTVWYQSIYIWYI